MSTVASLTFPTSSRAVRPVGAQEESAGSKNQAAAWPGCRRGWGGPAPRTSLPPTPALPGLGLWVSGGSTQAPRRGLREGGERGRCEGGPGSLLGADKVGGGRGSLNDSPKKQVPAGPGQAWGQALFSFLTPRVQGSQDNAGLCQHWSLLTHCGRELCEGLRVPCSTSAPDAV